MNTKIELTECTQCHRKLSANAFSKNTRASNGLFSWCKICDAERTKKWRAEHKDDPSFRARMAKGQVEYRKRYPEKELAHRLASKLPIKETCENCGDVRKLHRHHPSYSKPLEIITLCVSCHEEVHHGVML